MALGDRGKDFREATAVSPAAIRQVQHARRGIRMAARAAVPGEVAAALRDLIEIALVCGDPRIIVARRCCLRHARRDAARLLAAAAQCDGAESRDRQKQRCSRAQGRPALSYDPRQKRAIGIASDQPQRTLLSSSNIASVSPVALCNARETPRFAPNVRQETRGCASCPQMRDYVTSFRFPRSPLRPWPPRHLRPRYAPSAPKAHA